MGISSAACGSGDGDSTTSPRSQPEGSAPEIPEGGDAVVVQFTTGGGMTGQCCYPLTVPTITAYGDGRIVVSDAATGQVPMMRQATVSRTALIDLLGDAAEAGLFDDAAPDTGGVLCCDLEDTRVVLTDATTTHELHASGLSTEDDSAELTPEQREVRQAIIDLAAGLLTLGEESDDETEYIPDELAVYVSAVQPAPTVDVPAWPLDVSLDDGSEPADRGGHCIQVTTETDTLLDAFAARDPGSTLWASAGQTWNVIVRPLLPHEHGCP